MFTRREFLGRGAIAGLSAVSLSGRVPGLFAEAAAAAAKQGASDRVLIVIEMAGGNDGLNTLVPFENDLYFRNRPTLAISKKEVIRLNDQVGLHPSLKPLGELFKQGNVAIVQGVGYPEPDRSHFRSMEIWHTANTGRDPSHTGWLGRYLDTLPQDKNADSLAGMALTDALPQALQAVQFAAPVISSLDALEVEADDAPVPELLRELSKSSKSSKDTSGSVAFIRAQADSAFRIAKRLKAAKAGYKSTVEYPQTDLAGQLRRAAQIIAGDLGTRVLFVSQDGYDTHAGQRDGHAALLAELADALAALQQDLERLQLADKVVTMAFSEFGRRVDENASQGTDHGAASCMFLVGTQVQSGLTGTYPDLKKLGDGDLIFNIDFRAVYATLLDGWLRTSSRELLGAKFGHLPLLATAES